MKSRSVYWLGLGSGLIIGAILMQLMSSAGTPQPIDPAALEEAAARYGYRLVGENEGVQIVQEGVIRAIYISPDMTIEQVAGLLTESGLVASSDIFLNEMAKLSESVQISPGYYEFSDQPAVAELVKTLTAGDGPS